VARLGVEPSANATVGKELKTNVNGLTVPRLQFGVGPVARRGCEPRSTVHQGVWLRTLLVGLSGCPFRGRAVDVIAAAEA
jgi:hypothetical protein